MIKKQMYEAPESEVLELALGGAVLTASPYGLDPSMDTPEETYSGGGENWY